jgi:hypothetical protein
MTRRARPSGIVLTAVDATIVKGMLERGDRQHDVAAWFGVNPGRIAEIASGREFTAVRAASEGLPPPGPYLSARDATVALAALETAREALAAAELLLRRSA